MDHRTPAKHSWLQGDVVHRMKAVFAADELRFVGGVVRDSLLGRPIGDIDAAATLHPSEVMARAKAAGLKAIPTGIDHGTVTLLVAGQPIEITTLRHDENTDGRRAEVSFHASWEDDALRRDFTMNALYLDFDGVLYDYFDGEADLMAGRVRFIGDAVARIHEDALRMLRFFRFYAHYGKAAADLDALQAIADHVALADGLSVERIWREMKKIIAAPKPLPTLELMLASGLWLRGLSKTLDTVAFDTFLHLEDVQQKADPLMRLSMWLVDAEAVRLFARAYKLSNRERDHLLAAMGDDTEGVSIDTDDLILQKLLYRHGVSKLVAQTMRTTALSQSTRPQNLEGIASLIRRLEHLPVPLFPLTGGDLIKAGFSAGPELGALLKTIEGFWLDQNFTPDQAALIAYAKSFAA